jgi:DNA primase
MDELEVILDLLEDILGKPKKSYNGGMQISYNCPMCDDGGNKGNLEVNINKSLFHCWACSDVNGTSGVMGKLFDKFGTKKQKKLYQLIRPEELKKEEIKKTKLKLPEGYTTFENSNPIYPPHRQALNYLKERGVTDDMIKRYQIGYTVEGSYAYRIIIPSYDIDGTLNYFIARSWVKTKLKYKNPTAAKDEIIFNERLINWDKPIFITEGVFDSIFLPNSIPMLGKAMSSLLFETLYNKANETITVCLDSDAWSNALKLYHELNGGRLYNKIKIIKLTGDKDVCDLQGKIDEFYFEIK